MKPAPTPGIRAAFTLRELLIVVSTLTLVTCLHLPSLGTSRSVAQRASCLDNLRQLARAWNAHAEDNEGRLAGNLDGGNAQIMANTNRTWAIGYLTLDSPRLADNTNWLALLHSQLGPYARSRFDYVCPADASLGPVPGGQRLPRVRSYSMNGYIGRGTEPYTSGYRQFRKASELVEPSPDQLLLLVEEREDSINDGHFAIDMTGYDPLAPDAYRLVNYPAQRHNRAGNLAFIDGHTETWRWQDPRTTPVHRLNQPLPLNVPSPHNPDVARVQAGASRRIQP